MACDECDRCRELGYKFCNKCGASLSEDAIRYEETPKVKQEDDVLSKLALPSVMLIVVAMVADVILLVANIDVAWEFIYSKTITVYLYFLVDVDIANLTGLPAQLYVLFLIVCLILACARCFWESRSLFRLDDPDYMDESSKTPIFWLGLLFGTTTVVELILTLLLQSSGGGVEIPEWISKMTFEQALISYTRAAVWEEIAFRMVLFGVPMMIVALAFRQKDFYRYLLGGFGSSKIAIILLILTTAIFAYAHVGSWGLWKMVPTMVGGMAMGYMYMRFGIHASIAVHLITDYMGLFSVTEFAGLETLWIAGILMLSLICFPLLFKKTCKGLFKIKGMSFWGFDVSEEGAQNESR